MSQVPPLHAPGALAPGVRDRRRALAVGVVGAAYAGVAASLDPPSAPMFVATAIPCVAAVAADLARSWHRPALLGPGPPPCRAKAGYAMWAGLAGVVVAFQLAMLTSGPRRAYPTLSSLAEIGFESWPVRTAAFGLWLAAGAWLVRRADGSSPGGSLP